ncbi:MAG: hypothetical protein VB120_01930 [Lachnospiraceae bacterium]|nr:hypothetical protein [Lachnospiraceae bacterium]
MKRKLSKRQKAASILAIIITVMLVLSMLTPYLSYFIYGAQISAKESGDTSQPYAFEEEEFSKGGFSVNVTAGKNGMCFPDVENSIEVTLKSETDFNGWFVLKVPTGRNVPEGQRSNFVTYSYEISLSENEEKKISAEKILNSNIPVLIAELKDQTGDEVFSKNIDLVFDTSGEKADVYYKDAQESSLISNEYKFMTYMNNLSGRIPFLGGTRMWGIFTAIGVYAVAVTFLYVVLKKRDKREMAWVIIPVLSVCAALTVYLLSMGSSYKKNITNTINVIIEENGDEEASLFSNMCIISPNKGDILLELDENKDFGFDFYDYQEENDDILRASALNGQGAYSNAVFYDTAPWDKNYLFYSETIESSGLLADITIDGSLVKGSVTNGGEKELSDVILVIGREACCIGDFKPGAVFDVNIDIGSDKYLNYFDFNMISEEAFPDISNRWDAKKLIEAGGETEYSVYEKNIRRTFFENSLNYLYDKQEGLKMPVMLFAFDNAGLFSKAHFVNMEEGISLAQDMYVMDLSIDLSGSKNYYLPFGFLLPSLITVDGETAEYYSKSDLYFYTFNGGFAEISFDLSSAYGVKGMEMTWENAGDVFAFNCKTDKWEKVTGSLNTDYLSEEGSLKVKTEVLPETDMVVPMISVRGGL